MASILNTISGLWKSSEDSKKGYNIVSEYRGQYELFNNIAKGDLEELAANPKTQSLQFSNPLNNQQIELLEKIVFSRRPDILLRVYGHYGQICDLSPIERIPSLRKISADCLMDARDIEVVINLKNLEHLGVGIFNLDNFDFLENINPNITNLYLHQTRTKKPKIDSISRFTELEYLYLEGQQKGIEAVNDLKKLQKIVLRSISTQNVDFLKGLEQLWSVDVKLGGIKNLDALSALPQIKYLELWQVRGLSDLSVVSKLTTLQNLFLQSLKQLEKLPDFRNCISLRRIYLENLKSLIDISSLETAPKLKEFIYVMAQNQNPENMISILRNPSVESVTCGFGSEKKNNCFDQLMKQFNKQRYTFEEFVYE